MKPQRLQPVRVLFLDHVPRMSGAEQSLLDLVEGLSQGPVEPVVVLPSDGPLAAELRARGVLVRMVPMARRMIETSRATLATKPITVLLRLWSFLVAGLRIYRLMREVRPKVVHTNTLKSHLIAILPCKLARVPLIWHVRDILPDGWLRRAFLACSRFADIVIVPSRAVAEPFKGHKNLHRKLRLIPNGVHVDDFQQAKNDRSLREMLGAAPQDPVIGIVARVAPWKGQDVFVRAAAMLADRYPRAHFAIIGGVLFPENDEAYEWQLQRMILGLGVEERVSFLGWQPAPEAMAACDIVVHASIEPEPFGRTIIEAMAAGKPVVAAAGGAVQEILPPAAGFIVPPGRPELLADALDRLLSDRKLRKRMGEAGAAVADSFFPVARTVQGVAQLYGALVRQQAMRNARRAARYPWLAKRRARVERKAQRKRAPVPQPLTWPRPQDVPGGPTRGDRLPGRPVARGGRPSPAPNAPELDPRGYVRQGDSPRRATSAEQARASRAPMRAPFVPSPVRPRPGEGQHADEPVEATQPPVEAERRPGRGRRGRSLPAARARRRFVVELEADDEPQEMVFDDALDLLAPGEDETPPRGGGGRRSRTPVLAGAAEATALAVPVPAEARPRPQTAPPAPVLVAAPAPAPERVAEPMPYAPDPSTALPFELPPARVFAPRPLYDLTKRAIDVALALAVLLVGLPLWLLVAILIKLDSRGPVFHTATVYGRGCRPFRYYKFRSMRVDGDDRAHRTFIQRYVRENGGLEQDGRTIYKLMGDDRVTSVGRFIRALSIDEIPQLINVVRGEMSIVGPRPPLDYEFELYDERAKLRLTVRPGITGLQQVRARHEASFIEKLRLDLDYIARRSVLVDLAIMLRTIPAALRGH